MLVRILKALTGNIDGFDVGNLKVGTVYDLPTSLASLLIVEEYALSEMRGSTGESRDRGKRERSSNGHD
ncbi:MAG: hypothetical protein EHM89_03525 [Acidobacteria bacterium]|jgi:hypothetical protein|nr:MAG: hypothetical protein EHM89_03525 [Acidobacteriota bacterium]